jgi:hypothetical protein
MFSVKHRIVLSSLILLALIGCSVSQREAQSDQWPEMQFIIDGRVEIRLIVPPAKSESGTFEPQFISSSSGSLERMFIANYDPGRGRDRDLLLTNIGSNIIRLERDLNDKSSPSLKNIKNEIYLAQDDAERKFDFVGEVHFNNRPWLQVNLTGKYRRGIAYSTIIDGGYALIVSMSIYGEGADKTKLYGTRHETLKTIVNSVRTYTE